MSLDDIILDHESNQCLFVCAKCGAEYVTRDMLAMHMMDSARAGMCIETDTVNNIRNTNNNTTTNSNNSHLMAPNEESIVSDQSSPPKLNESSNIFDCSQPYTSLPTNWIGERTQPIFNMLFNQLTLPHIYSLQNATVNANMNNIHSNHHHHQFMSLNHKIFSALEENMPSFKGFRNTSSLSSSAAAATAAAAASITDGLKEDDIIPPVFVNSKYQTNNLTQNVKMNLIHSLKVNKNDMFTTMATKDKIRISNGKSNANLNEYKGRLKNSLDDMSFSQTYTSPTYSVNKSFGSHNTSSTSNCGISKSLHLPAEIIKSTNVVSSKCTTTAQNKSQTEADKAIDNQDCLKIKCADTSRMKVCDIAKSSKSHKICKDTKNCNVTIKRSRSLPSPRSLWRNQQLGFETTPSRMDESSVLEKTNNLNTSDEILHKTRRDRKCYKRSGYKNLRSKFVNYNRSKFKVAQNSHIISQITNRYNPEKIDAVHSANCSHDEIVQHDNKQLTTSLDEGNNQKMKMIGNSQLIFPYICDYCQIGFVQQALFCLHMGMHCVNNPLKCNMCARNCLDVYDFFSHTLHF